jgi:hypothetical protein
MVEGIGGSGEVREQAAPSSQENRIANPNSQSRVRRGKRQVFKQ